jgi:hypothetical protein
VNDHTFKVLMTLLTALVTIAAVFVGALLALWSRSRTDAGKRERGAAGFLLPIINDLWVALDERDEDAVKLRTERFRRAAFEGESFGIRDDRLRDALLRCPSVALGGVRSPTHHDDALAYVSDVGECLIAILAAEPNREPPTPPEWAPIRYVRPRPSKRSRWRRRRAI